MRRFFYYLVSGLLLLLLVATTWSTALVLTFSNPSKTEAWLNQSGFYDNFVSMASQQFQKSQAGQANASSDTSLSNPEVQKAAREAFNPQVLQNGVNTFLNANYAWLQGKTNTPKFSIDLAQAKANMAANLADYTSSRAAKLPACTTAQLLQMENAGQTFDAFSATCLPAGISPASAAQTVQDDVLNSQNFLPNPVITPQNFNQQTVSGQMAANSSDQPYYQTFSVLPAAYHWAVRLPWILGGLCLLCLLVLLLAASTARKGLRRTATVLIEAGVVALLLILVENAVIHRLETHSFTTSNVGQLQQSLVNFVHLAQSSLARIDIWFGAGFVLVGAVIYLALFLPRRKKGRALPRRAAPSAAAQQPTPSPVAVTESQAQETPKRPPKPPTLIQL